MSRHLVLVLGATALLPALTVAQQTIPPGFLSTESAVSSSDYSYYFGGYSDGRFQFVSADFTGGKPQIITQLQVRRDGRTYSTSSAARTWSNVTVSLADSSLANMSTTWTRNQLSTPTTLFSAQVNWPAATSSPSSTPMPWNVTGYSFALGNPYIYTAQKDLLVDFQFTGGVTAPANPAG